MYTTDVYYLHFCQHHDNYNAGMCANISKCPSALFKIILPLMMLASKKYIFFYCDQYFRCIVNKTMFVFMIICLVPMNIQNKWSWHKIGIYIF